MKNSFINSLLKLKKDTDISSFTRELTALSDDLKVFLSELENIIDKLKNGNNVYIPEVARRIERSKKKKVMDKILTVVLIAIIVGAVAIYMFYIRGSSDEEYVPTNAGNANEVNRKYLDNRPTFTANDRAVLDLIMDLEQISKEVNQK